MKTYTTRAYAEEFAKLTEEEIRHGEMANTTNTITNESETIEVNLTHDEIDEYHRVYDASDEAIETDVINYETMDRLVHFLQAQDLLETPALGTHTPEPWEYRLAYDTDADHRRAVACVNGCKGVVDPETAIPELLAALKGLLSQFKTISPMSGLNASCYLAEQIKAEQAIAKATAITHPTE
jgi:hypothetical protein